MNADETVRGLRYTQKKYENKVILTGETDVSAMCRDSADPIESLQAQLAESQRRERAAVERLAKIDALCVAFRDAGSTGLADMFARDVMEISGPEAGEGTEE